MKKIYLISLFTMICILTNATDKYWSFTNGWATTDNSVVLLSQPYIQNGLTLSINYKIEDNNKYDPLITTPENIASYDFTKRLRLVANPNVPTPPNLPTISYCSFAVDGNATIRLWSSGISSVRFANSAGNLVATAIGETPPSGWTDTITVNYVGGPTTITVYPESTTLAFWIYAIKVTPYSPPTDAYNAIQNTIAIKENEIINEGEESINIYTINGTLIKNSKERYISIQTLNKGVYIARTESGKTLKFIK